MMKRNLVYLLLLIFLSISAPTFAQTNSGTQTTKQDTKEKVVYVTKTGSKYHGVNCGYLHSSSIKTNLSDAIKSGYTACSRCKGAASYKPKTTTKSASSRCSGTTQAGNRCKRMTKSSSGRCYQH